MKRAIRRQQRWKKIRKIKKNPHFHWEARFSDMMIRLEQEWGNLDEAKRRVHEYEILPKRLASHMTGNFYRGDDDYLDNYRRIKRVKADLLLKEQLELL